MLALYANTIATAVMVGVIWFVQVVHYPLLAQFGSTQSIAVAEQHQQRTGYVVGLPMLVEGVSTLWLLARTPDGVAVLRLAARFWYRFRCTPKWRLPTTMKLAGDWCSPIGLAPLPGRRGWRCAA
jgi:hypothetical protein